MKLNIYEAFFPSGFRNKLFRSASLCPRSAEGQARGGSKDAPDNSSVRGGRREAKALAGVESCQLAYIPSHVVKVVHVVLHYGPMLLFLLLPFVVQ